MFHTRLILQIVETTTGSSLEAFEELGTVYLLPCSFILSIPLTSSLDQQGSLSPPPSYFIPRRRIAMGRALGEGKEFESFVTVHDHLSLFVLLSPSMIVTPDCNVCI